MQTAVASPHPYLLNKAGGIVQIRSFSLTHGGLHIEGAGDTPLVGIFQLVYRCPDHNRDIKRHVSSDGQSWTMLERIADDEDCDVCYPGPCD